MTDAPDDRTDRESQLDAILGAFHEAAAAGSEPDRLGWVARHPEFAAELAAYFVEQDRFFRLAAPLRAAASGPDAPGLVVGNYELVGELGRGGMGVVYRARQEGLNRVVALKLILSGEFAGPADVRRFHAEAEAVAQLDHPNIVPIYEVGTHQGRHYFSMKLYEGGTLASRPGVVRGVRVPGERAARLVSTIARAVHHAHQRGILHRDLKPSNILLDADGQPHVADFGLAKRLGADAEATHSGALIGSPPYMAPEQAEGRKRAVTVATDVHGLGAILYALLTGQAPFAADSALESLEQVKNHPPVPPGRVVPRLSRDLETVCLKCLEKDPARRYPSALALAEDLERWLRGEPIAVRPVGPLERVWRWTRRRWVGLSAAAAGLLTVGLLAAGVRQSHLLREARRAAEAGALAARQRDHAARLAEYVSETRRAWRLLASTQSNVGGVAPVLDALRPGRGREDVRGFEWGLLQRMLHTERATLRGHEGEVYNVRYSPDGKLLASAGQDRLVRVWDAASGSLLRTLRGHDHEVNWVAFSPDGAKLATASDDGTVGLWDVAEGRREASLSGHDGPAVVALFTPDGRGVVSGGRDHKLILWDRLAGEPRCRVDATVGGVDNLAIAPDAPRLAVCGGNGAALWSFGTGRGGEPWRLSLEGAVDRDQGFSVAFSDDGRLVAVGSVTGSVQLYDAVTRWPVGVALLAQSRIESLAFLPGGRVLAGACSDGAVRLWDIQSAGRPQLLYGHEDRVWCVVASPDGRSLATAGGDGQVKLWDPAHRPDRRRLPLGSREAPAANAYLPVLMAFRPDGALVAATKKELLVYDAWEDARPRLAWRADLPEDYVELTTALSRDGRRLCAFAPSRVQFDLWDTVERKREFPPRIEGLFRPRALGPDGSLAVQILYKEREMLLLDLPRGRVRFELRPPGGFDHFEPPTVWIDDHRVCLVASGKTGRCLAVVDARTGATRVAGRPFGQWVGGVTTVTPDGRSLITGGPTGPVEVWDLTTLEFVRELPTMLDAWSLAVSPDGRTLATGGGDGSVRLWNLATGQEFFALPDHDGVVWAVVFSPDGRRLASCGPGPNKDFEILVRDSAPRDPSPAAAAPGDVR